MFRCKFKLLYSFQIGSVIPIRLFTGQNVCITIGENIKLHDNKRRKYKDQ